MWYHLSPARCLHQTGINVNYCPTVSYRRSPYVYLGGLDYLYEQYLKYAPHGMYFLYLINTSGLELNGNLPGNQVRVTENIAPARVKYVKWLINK